LNIKRQEFDGFLTISSLSSLGKTDKPYMYIPIKWSFFDSRYLNYC